LGLLSAFGLFFSVFLLFAAVLAWQLGGIPAEIFARLRRTGWRSPFALQRSQL